MIGSFSVKEANGLMKVRHIVSVSEEGTCCMGGHCPSVYETDRGTYLIQGKILDSSVMKDLSMPSDETAVEIPLHLIDAFLAKRNQAG
jgi:hypothetical protein